MESLITIPKSYFFLLLGLIWQFSSIQTKYNEGCSKLNYTYFKYNNWVAATIYITLSSYTGSALKRES